MSERAPDISAPRTGGRLLYLRLLDFSIVALGSVSLAVWSMGARRTTASLRELPLLLLGLLIVARLIHGRLSRIHQESPTLQAMRALATSLHAPSERLRRSLLWAILLFSTALTLHNAIARPGFFSGDDVEVHLMTFKALFGLDGSIWNLRSAFYPMAFIYPIQAAMRALGVTQTLALIVSGRCIVVLFSTLSVYLVYVVGRSVFGRDDLALIAALLLASNQLHATFGGTVFPRPVSSCFVLISFWALHPKGASTFRLVLAGVALGVAQSLRFSAVLFLVPAALDLLSSRRKMKHLAVLGLSFLGSWLAIQLVCDTLYWGHPFASLVHIVKYTLVLHGSSRGFQPPLDYLRTLPHWSNFAVVLLALASVRRRPRLAAWAWAPLVFLSFLPHKEPRYLIPAIPFICLAAADTSSSLGDHLRARSDASPRRWAPLFAPIAAIFLLGSCGYEATHLDFHKHGQWIAGVEYLERTRARGTIALEDYELHGGARLFLRHDTLLLLQKGDFAEPTVLEKRLRDPAVLWLVLRDETVRAHRLKPVLRALGFRDAPSFRPSTGAIHVYSR